MFKKTKQPDHIVGHRLGGNHAKRDPLLDEKVGSSKRCRTEDGSASVVYKETLEEKKARLAAEKQAEKELRKGIKAPASQAEGSSQPQTASGSTAVKRQETKAKLSALASFKDRLRESNLPEAAADAEKKHKDSMKEEEAKALAKTSSSSEAAAEKPPDLDERLSMNDIWKASEGDEEGSGDWLQGNGLKFHTTADKAFSMAAKRFKESVECHDPLAGEAAADQAKKRSELRMAEMRRQTKK